MDSWSDLPYDLLEIIAKKLRHKELLYFGFVCKSWRFFYLENCSRLPADLPILFLRQHKLHRAPVLLKSCKPVSDSRKYVCAVDEKVQGEIFLPEAANKWICGSSRGWLVTRDIKGREISLLNPFTRCEIKLPSLANLPLKLKYNVISGYAPIDCVDSICKAIISTDPISNPQDCVVMAISGGMRSLCFCKLGDSEWTIIQGNPMTVDDVIHYQDRFYTTTKKGYVVSYDAKNPNAHEPEDLGWPGTWSEHLAGNTYLVLSGRDLLQIHRKNVLSSCRGNPKKSTTVGFEVMRLVKRESWVNNKSTYMGVLGSLCFFIKNIFKIETYEDQKKYHWSKLEGVPDRLIFIGLNGSFSVPSSVHPNCKGNTIYFGDDYRSTHFNNLILSDNLLNLDKYPFKYYHHDIGVYDMEDKRSRSYNGSEQFDILPAIWIIPDPW